jgi:hypothetical protein
MTVTVSLEVPYADTEQQFLILAVQTAVRTFRNMNACSGRPFSSSSTKPSSSCSSALNQTQEALKES